MEKELEGSKGKKVYKRLTNKYRLVILNDDTFEEKVSLQLTPMNVFTYFGLIGIALIIGSISLIAFTPLREYIPGYSDIETRKKAAYAVLKLDSLEKRLNQYQQKEENLMNILNGNPPIDTIKEETSSINSSGLPSDIKSKEDSLFREKIESEEKYTISDSKGEVDSRTYFFFTPVKGTVSASFNPNKNHYGVDVVTVKDESIKAVLDGTVILSAWTTKSGYVIQVQHRNNMISAYKHCSVLLKKEGESIKAGDAIAIVGNSGEQTTGPHLHFELWENGKALDPEDLIVF